MGAVDMHDASHANVGQLLNGTFSASSVATVFLTEQGAVDYMTLIRQSADGDPDLTAITVPALGAETAAYETTVVLSGLPFTVHIIYVRKHNVVTSVTTTAVVDVASPADAQDFAAAASAKICDG